MALSFLFYLLLALPGFCIIRRWFPDETRSGLLGAFVVSTVATLALLTPLSILCYVLRLPQAVFTLACVALIVAGGVACLRNGWWRDLWSMARRSLGVEIVIIALAAGLAFAAGGDVTGDASLHLTRIRDLIDNGVSNHFPFIKGEGFFSLYHTNLEHILVAAGAQAGGTDHFGAWFGALAWSKLVMAGAGYYLAWTIAGKQWAGWLGAMLVIGRHAPVAFTMYPNQLAPFFLYPLALAFALQAFTQRRSSTDDEQPALDRVNADWRLPVKLLVIGLLLGQFHGLYAGAAAMLLAPLLAARFVWDLLREKTPNVRVLLCALALAPGLLFPLVTHLSRQHADAAAPQQRQAQTEAEASPRQTDQPGVRALPTNANTIELPGGMVIRDPMRGFGSKYGYRYILLVGACILLIFTPRRWFAAGVLGATATIALVFFVPPVTTRLLVVLGEAWVLDRVFELIRVGYLGVLPAALAVVLDKRLRPWWAHGAVSAGVLLVSVLLLGGENRRTDWKHLFALSFETSVFHTLADEFRDREAFLRSNGIPQGAVVLVDPVFGLRLTCAYDVRLIVTTQAGLGVPDRRQRQRDFLALLSPDLPWPERRRLLQKYDVRYYWPTRTTIQVLPVYSERARRDLYDNAASPKHRIIELRY